MIQKDRYTRAEVAEIFDVALRTVDEWIERRRIGSIKVGGKVWVPAEAIFEFVKRHTIMARWPGKHEAYRPGQSEFNELYRPVADLVAPAIQQRVADLVAPAIQQRVADLVAPAIQQRVADLVAPLIQERVAELVAPLIAELIAAKEQRTLEVEREKVAV